MSNFKIPTVTLLQCSNFNISEVAGRTCYDSFHRAIEPMCNFKYNKNLPSIDEYNAFEYLNNLINVKFHSSIAEHMVMTFYIENLSRGVLQQLVRHRIASYSVQSTRYTMSSLLILTMLHFKFGSAITKEYLKKYIIDNVIVNIKYSDMDAEYIINRLTRMFLDNPYDIEDVMSKSQIEFFNKNKQYLLDLFYTNKLNILVEEFKKPKAARNIGDEFKEIVSDIWGTNLVVTFNLRSFINFYNLRSKNSAWEPIRELAIEMFKVLPLEYKKLITKGKYDAE